MFHKRPRMPRRDHRAFIRGCLVALRREDTDPFFRVLCRIRKRSRFIGRIGVHSGPIASIEFNANSQRKESSGNFSIIRGKSVCQLVESGHDMDVARDTRG